MRGVAKNSPGNRRTGLPGLVHRMAKRDATPPGLAGQFSQDRLTNCAPAATVWFGTRCLGRAGRSGAPPTSPGSLHGFLRLTGTGDIPHAASASSKVGHGLIDSALGLMGYDPPLANKINRRVSILEKTANLFYIHTYIPNYAIIVDFLNCDLFT